MDLKTRESKYEDLESLIKFCKPDSKELEEILRYRMVYFTETGQVKHVLTSYPDELIVVEINGELVGYLQYYQDNLENGEHILVAVVSNPNLKPELQNAIKSLLMAQFEID